jgi:hypothetical protein
MELLYCSCCKRDLPKDAFTQSYWVEKKNAPRRCKECVHTNNQKWYSGNRGYAIAYMAQYRKESKDAVFNSYGGYICACCGETEKRFLSIDHIDGGGNKHRKETGMKSGNEFYIWLRLQNFPPGYQVLCYNCNLGKRHNNNVCPHEEQRQMAKFKANPLGLLEGELVWNAVVEKEANNTQVDVDSAPSFRAQVPVKEGLAGQDTFKMDASQPSSRAPVELRRMHLAGGEDVGEGSEVLKGSNMYNEFGGGTGKSAGEFTENKSK